MAFSIPLLSREVRWFFNGNSGEHESLRHWFETSVPLTRKGEVGPPAWQGRLGDRPDVYLLLPGGRDMGIKWREGEFQVKGRTSSDGIQVFCGRHRGEVENWIKWSYPKMPSAYEELFLGGRERGLITAAVSKVRAMRKVHIDCFGGAAEEVAATARIDRGLGIELADIRVGDDEYCSLGIEAFPHEATMGAAFTRVVEAFLDSLREIDLSATRSQSYPGWLDSLKNA